MYFKEKRALELLKEAYGNEAEFREGQLEAIIAVLEKKKILVVQKTGWGKSVVYFIATRMLREDGAGPSIIISPLLALMNNQIESAEKLGVHAVTINSMNENEHQDIYRDMETYDAIIISPEKLSNDIFMEHLATIKNVQLFVVDEAHSISDWGHDFRPDYQRIVQLIEGFPSNMAILGTTATANNRVIEDIKNQLGQDLNVVRGDLIRENIAIQINPCQTREQRLAWLTQILHDDIRLKDKQGIIYCLTRRDCEIVAGFLKKNGLSAEAYYSGMGKDLFGDDIEQERIKNFDQGNIRILVATIKLGMGYDKSDIRFVIHYQLPQNLISYYQQIGRAGRDGKIAYAILLHGNEDEEILNHFIENAQAKPELLNDILNFTINGKKRNEILSSFNINITKLSEALKYLMIHDHIYKDKTVYRRNVVSEFDQESEEQKQKSLNRLRQDELEKLKKFLTISSCYMKYVADELDAPDRKLHCGICANCKKQHIFSLSIQQDYLVNSSVYLKNRYGKIFPRKKWADGKKIPDGLTFEEGWVLSNEYYSETGQQIKKEKYDDGHFSDDIITKSANYIRKQVKENHIDLVVAVPSCRRIELVPDFAQRLSNQLGLEFKNIVHKTKKVVEQKTLHNSIKQQENIVNSIYIQGNVQGKRILLVDDMVDSRWTFTVIAAKLLELGAEKVFPYALVKTGSEE